MKRGGAEDPIRLRPRFFRLTAINILANITVPLAGLVDTTMLGHLDDIRFLAGVALATLIFDVVFWSLGFLRMGTTGLTAQAHGRNDAGEVMAVLRRGGMVALTAATLLLALQWPIGELGFGLLAGEPEVEQAGRQYFNARIWGAPATLLNFVLIGWLLGLERSRDVLAMTAVANVSNIGFNYWFIIELGWAARGAGLATMLSQVSMLAAGLLLYRMRRLPIPWSRQALLARDRLLEVVLLNRDLMIRTLLLVGCFSAFTNLSSTLGVTALAANTILLRVFYVASYSIDGAAIAAESLGGMLRGAKDHRRLRRLVKLSLTTGLIFSGLFLVLFLAAPRWWIGLLTSHDDVAWYAAYFSPWMIPVLLFGSLAFVYDGLFIGLTEGTKLRNSMLFSAVVCFAPAAAVGFLLESNSWLWAAMALLMAARALSLGWTAKRLLAYYEADAAPVGSGTA